MYQTHSLIGRSLHSALYAGMCVVLTAILPAHAAHLTVQVRDALAQPVAGAHVWADDTAPRTGVTDAAGRCVLSNMPARVVLAVARDGRHGRAVPQRANCVTNVTLTFVLPHFSAFRCGAYNLMGYDGWTTQQIAALTRILWTVQPDVLCLQECPDTGLTFSAFQSQRMPGYTNAVSWVGGPVRNGFLSIYPMVSTISYGASEMTRDAYTARIALPVMGDTTFISVHLKAGGTSNDGVIRNAEAAFVGALCSNLYRQATYFMLAGDCNDDPAFVRPPSDVHGILAAAGAGLVQLAPRDDSGSTATYPSFSRRYDFLYPAQPWSAFAATTCVVRTDTMTARPAWLAAGDSATASDHALIYADFLPIPEPCLTGVLLLLVCLQRAFVRTESARWRC